MTERFQLDATALVDAWLASRGAEAVNGDKPMLHEAPIQQLVMEFAEWICAKLKDSGIKNSGKLYYEFDCPVHGPESTSLCFRAFDEDYKERWQTYVILPLAIANDGIPAMVAEAVQLLGGKRESVKG